MFMFNYIKSLSFELGFVNVGSNYTSSLINFYNLICVLLVLITFLIGFWITFILVNYRFKKIILLNLLNLNFILEKNFNLKTLIYTGLNDRSFSYLSLKSITDYPQLEGSWCVLPLGFVSTVSYPSIGLEYGLSPDITPLVTLKVIANQWYWVFELEAKTSPGLVEGGDVSFFFESDLYKLYQETYGDAEAFYEGLSLLEFQELSKTVEVNLNNEVDPGFYRLLAVDNKIILPVNTPIKIIVTSADVLHSFALPSLSVKIDAVPGRLSEQIILIEKPGLYWGQCSELCGPYHGFMPVAFEVNAYPIFLKQFFN